VRHLDYRISMYQPMAYVARHKHKVQEQIYHVLEGGGLDGDRPARTMWCASTTSSSCGRNSSMPSRTRGLVDLVFLVITSPRATPRHSREPSFAYMRPA